MKSNRILLPGISILICLALVMGCTQPAAKTETEEPKISQEALDASFTQTLQQHLNAVSNKDLEILKATLSPKGDMQLILPASEITNTTEAFLDMHEAWFQDSSWTFETKILHTDIGQEMGIAIVEVMYREPDRNGKPYFNKMAVSYALRNMAGNWYVVKDHACSLEKPEN